MSEEFDKEIAKSLVEQTAGKAYDDVAHPSAKAIGTVLSFIPRTIRLWFSKWEKWIINGEYAIEETAELLKDKLNRIAPEKITEPEPYVAVPAIQQLQYCFNSAELREMYANLLASSMNEDTKWSVHPSFVDIIKQLTPDEAKIIKYLYDKQTGLPLVSIRKEIKAKNGFVPIIDNYSNIGELLCEEPENILSYIDNLERLKIVYIPKDEYYLDDNLYTDVENSNRIKELMCVKCEDGAENKIKKGKLEITEYGKAFASVCLKD